MDSLSIIYKNADNNVASVDRKSQKRTEIDDISILWHELLSPLTIIKGYTSTLLELDYAINEEQSFIE